MSLSNDDVLAILALLDASRFEELLVETSDYKLHLRRSAADRNGVPSGGAFAHETNSERAPFVSPSSRPAPPTEPSPFVPADVAGARARPDGSAALDVKAPLLGTFYGAPQPGAAPFVAIGDVVDETTVVAIVEVMKLMNSVCAGTSGVVVEILARDGQLVEYGEPLMRIAPARA